MTASYAPPATGDYPPYFASYLRQVPEDDPVAVMAGQLPEVQRFFEAIPEARMDHAYAPGKWTIREVLGHLSDTERVMSYRTLSFARGDQARLPGFDENRWIAPAGFRDRTARSLIDEWVAVRRATLSLFESLPAAARDARGVANENPLSVRAIAYMIPGHVRHHLGVARERYL